MFLLSLCTIATVIITVESVPISDIKSGSSNNNNVALPVTNSDNKRSVTLPSSTKLMNLLLPKKHHKIDKRSITAFVTDPALLVTILHSLEVAYWTMPFGFLLQPIINLFRMPNRRSDTSSGFNFNSDAKVRELYRNLIRTIHKFETLEHKQHY